MKVYLSKSNACKVVLYMRVQELLQTLDCEVVEFHGGEYSNKELLKCDMLVVLSPDIDKRSKYGDGIKMPIGKGQYQQITDFLGKNYDFTLSKRNNKEFNIWEPSNKKLILLVSDIQESGGIYVDELKGIRTTPIEDWKTNWAETLDYDMKINITNYISQRKYVNKPIRGGVYKDELEKESLTVESHKLKLHLACERLFKK